MTLRDIVHIRRFVKFAHVVDCKAHIPRSAAASATSLLSVGMGSSYIPQLTSKPLKVPY